jgi:osmotically-inducible protein OsmY
MKSSLAAALLGGILFSFPSFADGPASSDALITAKTKLTLWTTDGVRSTTVHVDTNDGVVTLHGKVPTAAQRDLAESTTTAIAGVRKVNNLLQVVAVRAEAATARSDREITDATRTVLRDDTGLKNSSISVKTVDKGVVLLTGVAASYGDHLRAISEVDGVPGVRRVATEVVAPTNFSPDEHFIFRAPAASTDSGANDSRISMAVKLRLFTAVQVPSTEISVDTSDAVVVLFGIVPTAAVRYAAGGEASKVSGVKRVDNQLEVVSTADKKTVDAKDTDITRDLALAFKDRPDQKNVTTSVKN